jgi:hypothetical protein
MLSNKNKSLDYQSLASKAKKNNSEFSNQSNLKSVKKQKHLSEDSSEKGLFNRQKKGQKNLPESISEITETKATYKVEDPHFETETNSTNSVKQKKQEKKAAKDRKILSSDRWLTRNGHALTFVGLYLFSVLVLFRPYELTASLAFLSSTAFYLAAITLLVYLPTQLTTEGNLTTLSTEVKCILAMTFLAVLTMPLGKDAARSWETFSDVFIKVVLIFIVMVNVVRTKLRLMSLLWLSLAIGIYLSVASLYLFFKGELKIEGYRVGVEIGGMLGNPNDLALHLVTMTPLAVVLGIASRSKAIRYFYFAVASLLVAANMVTFSRGGFLGLIASAAVLAWKIGRDSRLKVALVSMVAGGLFILLAPGNYGLRLLSIFVPGLDPVGSSDQRKELLLRSIYVSLRNPLGIGMNNSALMNDFNLQWHNSFTQISSELGLLGLAAYLIFMVSPFFKLAAIERTLYAENRQSWFYFMAIGLQASFVAYLFSSFFVSVAYNWFIYYLVAYAIAFRRIYQIKENTNIQAVGGRADDERGKFFGWQTA